MTPTGSPQNGTLKTQKPKVKCRTKKYFHTFAPQKHHITILDFLFSWGIEKQLNKTPVVKTSRKRLWARQGTFSSRPISNMILGRQAPKDNEVPNLEN